MRNSTARIVGGVLLIAGTAIGAGMLVMPVTTGLMGFFPTAALFFVYWLYFLFTAFLFLEVNLWFIEHDVNLVSMAKRTLGRTGEWVSWVFYLFLLYALTTAYIAGSAPLFKSAFLVAFGWEIPSWMTAFPLVLLFGFFVYEGARAVDYLNRLLMIGLIVTFCLLTGWLIPKMDASLLGEYNLSVANAAVSLIATSFGFHIVIPSLTRYLNRDVAALRKVIFIGATVPLLIYTLWELITLGVIPFDGPHGLREGYLQGRDSVDLIVGLYQSSSIAILGQFFAFFAIVTSFLGVTLSLRDFLADGLKIKKTATGRWVLYFLTFLPPLVFTLTDPRAFFSALNYAGAFGVMTLLGILPALMVWFGRYKKGYSSEKFKTPGERPALILIIVFSLAVIIIEIGNQIGVFKIL